MAGNAVVIPTDYSKIVVIIAKLCLGNRNKAAGALDGRLQGHNCLWSPPLMYN